MGDWFLDRYDGMRERDIPEEYRATVRHAQRVRDRRELAVGMGHPDWAQMPPSAPAARVSRSPMYFTGEKCRHGHVAPRWTSSGQCSECAKPAAERKADIARRQAEADRASCVRIWETRFDMVARRMIDSGRVCYWKDGRIVETSVAVRWPDSVEAACAKAARQTVNDGKLRCVVNGTRGMVVKMVAR